MEIRQLSPEDPPFAVYEEITQLKEDFMIVGHLPLLGRLASIFITGDEYNHPVKFKPATVVTLEGEHGQPFHLADIIEPDTL